MPFHAVGTPQGAQRSLKATTKKNITDIYLFFANQWQMFGKVDVEPNIVSLVGRYWRLRVLATRLRDRCATILHIPAWAYERAFSQFDATM
ncbi:hypothetical protein ABH922_001226 [Rhodococcus sp. 27YEA15]